MKTKALVLKGVGFPPKLEEIDLPTPNPGEVVVRLNAAALNHRDIWIQHGKYPGISTPIVLGSDGVGVVAAGSATWAGREVVVCPSIAWGEKEAFQGPQYEILGLPRNGTFAEHVSLPESCLVPKPPHLNRHQAAALPLAGLTAWRALVTRAALQPGERVLISGVGGGVALFGLQFAVALGCEVFVTSSSPEKIDRACELGAKGGVLYTEANWADQLARLTPAGFDVILDGAGGEGFKVLVRALGMGGRIVFYGGTRGKWPEILPQHLFYKQASILGSTMGSTKEFEAMVGFVAEKKLVPVVDRVFPLANGAEAFAYLAGGAQFGKVVLDIAAP